MTFKNLLLSAVVTIGTMGIAAPSYADADPFIADIMTVGFNFCPRGWAETNGQLLPIATNTALFSLVGTTYGGDGRTTFGLPDFRSRAPIHVGNGAGLTNRSWGQRLGTETETMTTAQLPSHTHRAGIQTVNDAPTSRTPANNSLTTLRGNAFSSSVPAQYNPPGTPYAPSRFMNPGTVYVESVGGGQSQNNMQPSLAMYTCIALTGVYPSRN